jgi:hypothetical protein
VAAADVNGDGISDIITGAGPGGGPHVKVIDGAKLNQVDQTTGVILDSALIYGFFAYSPTFTGGVRVATGDVNADGLSDIITAAGPGGGPHVQVFNGANLSTIYSFFAFSSSFAGGVFVASGDIDGDGRADIIASQDTVMNAHVRTFSGATGLNIADFIPFTSAIGPGGSFSGNSPNGVTVAAVDRDGDGFADVVVGSGPNHDPLVKTFKGTNYVLLNQFESFDPTFLGGVFVG